MTTPTEIHPISPSALDTSKKGISTADVGTPISVLPWLAKMPLPNEMKISSHSDPAEQPAGQKLPDPLATSTHPEAKNKDQIFDDSPLTKPPVARDRNAEQVHLPRATQLASVPGVSNIIDLPLSAEIEQAAAIQEIAIALRREASGAFVNEKTNRVTTTILTPIRDFASGTATNDPDRGATLPLIKHSQLDRFSAVGRAAKQPDDGIVAAKVSRNVRGLVIGSIFAIVGACIWMSGWIIPSSNVPAIMKMAFSSVLTRGVAVEPQLSADSKILPSPEAVALGRRSMEADKLAIAGTAVPPVNVDERALVFVDPRQIANKRDDQAISEPRQAPAQNAESPDSLRESTHEAAAIAQPRSIKTPRKSDPEQAKLFVARAEQLMATGDVVAARTLLLRAAESDDPDAALALAAAYDPNVLARLGVIGIAADVQKARVWYEKARILGSTVAKRRLESLNR
jgi:hypothetical protein